VESPLGRSLSLPESPEESPLGSLAGSLTEKPEPLVKLFLQVGLESLAEPPVEWLVRSLLELVEASAGARSRLRLWKYIWETSSAGSSA
jgi:hypothetical protein